MAGLDERGELDALAFMPEMLQFCGQKFTLGGIAHKTCDTVNITGLHKMENTAHLAGVRCDGQAHGGCQAGCLIFWKTEWLTRVPGSDGSEPDAQAPSVANSSTTAAGLTGGCTQERLVEVAHGACRSSNAPAAKAEPVYSCQATELPRAMGGFISRWNARQYVDDVRYGNAPLGRVLWGIGVGIFNLGQAASRRILPRWLRIQDGLTYPFIITAARSTPAVKLGLEPGDWVRVKSAEEIGKTLDKNQRNRGLYFDREMIRYCGQTAQVLRQVDRIVEETTGRLITMQTPCVILSGGVCTADYHRSCPRAIYAYWREGWLERVAAPLSADEAP